MESVWITAAAEGDRQGLLWHYQSSKSSMFIMGIRFFESAELLNFISWVYPLSAVLLYAVMAKYKVPLRLFTVQLGVAEE